MGYLSRYFRTQVFAARLFTIDTQKRPGKFCFTMLNRILSAENICLNYSIAVLRAASRLFFHGDAGTIENFSSLRTFSASYSNVEYSNDPPRWNYRLERSWAESLHDSIPWTILRLGIYLWASRWIGTYCCSEARWCLLDIRFGRINRRGKLWIPGIFMCLAREIIARTFLLLLLLLCRTVWNECIIETKCRAEQIVSAGCDLDRNERSKFNGRKKMVSRWIWHAV